MSMNHPLNLDGQIFMVTMKLQSLFQKEKYRYVCEYLNIYLYIYKYLKDNIQFSKRSTCYMVNNKYIPTLGTYLYHTHKSNKVKLSNINLSVKRARM